MPDQVSRIQLLGPAELNAFLQFHMAKGDAARERLGVAFLRLLELHCSYIANQPGVIVGTIAPSHLSKGEEPNMLDWTIQRSTEANGLHGHRIINGGLVCHSDGVWGIHT